MLELYAITLAMYCVTLVIGCFMLLWRAHPLLCNFAGSVALVAFVSRAECCTSVRTLIRSLCTLLGLLPPPPSRPILPPSQPAPAPVNVFQRNYFSSYGKHRPNPSRILEGIDREIDNEVYRRAASRLPPDMFDSRPAFTLYPDPMDILAEREYLKQLKEWCGFPVSRRVTVVDYAVRRLVFRRSSYEVRTTPVQPPVQNSPTRTRPVPAATVVDSTATVHVDPSLSSAAVEDTTTVPVAHMDVMMEQPAAPLYLHCSRVPEQVSVIEESVAPLQLHGSRLLDPEVHAMPSEMPSVLPVMEDAPAAPAVLGDSTAVQTMHFSDVEHTPASACESLPSEHTPASACESLPSEHTPASACESLHEQTATSVRASLHENAVEDTPIDEDVQMEEPSYDDELANLMASLTLGMDASAWYEDDPSAIQNPYALQTHASAYESLHQEHTPASACESLPEEQTTTSVRASLPEEQTTTSVRASLPIDNTVEDTLIHEDVQMEESCDSMSHDAQSSNPMPSLASVVDAPVGPAQDDSFAVPVPMRQYRSAQDASASVPLPDDDDEPAAVEDTVDY
ncbi:hypothetical protein BDB00DRAFT_824312 [Zychaea mexicana]|uniref:uncharacterized protein n=1 Tax=Zychaea mexicana TaxID=64656 RepID=UPI0022FEC1B6|nr:uncharacterized protein BDB00DRAFT_824312 [Zychaea mexicana]KAI9493287.1 hypothetical protein BDB00DRAFT_824312 [Zychaea mexicana]